MEQLHYCPADAHWLLPTPPARTEDASSSRTVVVGHIPCSGQWNVSKCDVSRSPHMLYNITLFLGYSDLKWGKPSPGSRCISSPGPVTIPQGEHPSQSQQEPSAGNQHPEAGLGQPDKHFFHQPKATCLHVQEHEKCLRLSVTGFGGTLLRGASVAISAYYIVKCNRWVQNAETFPQSRSLGGTVILVSLRNISIPVLTSHFSGGRKAGRMQRGRKEAGPLLSGS